MPSIVVGLLISASLHLCAQQPAPQAADPFVRNAAPASDADQPAQSSHVPSWISVCYECFSMDLELAAKLYRQKLPDSQLYKEITDLLGQGEIKQEVFQVIRARSGERAILECNSEYIYPTEYMPADNTSAEAEKRKTDGASSPTDHTEKPAISVVPVSFETRNVGMTLEIEPTINIDLTIIDLRLFPEKVTLVDRSKWGKDEWKAEMPIFESQRFNTAATLITGQTALFGTPSRPPSSKVDPDSANRVWFAFVTADIIRIEKE